jgi:uncharacterized membrane protein SpoIIM required for sporulation
MLDDLRNQSEADFTPEGEPALEQSKSVPKIDRPRRSFDQITGTNAIQRFVLALLLFVTVCLIGFLLLIFTGKINPSFLY